MNAKFWILAAAMSVACIDSKDDLEEEEEEEETSSEPTSEPSPSEPAPEPSYAYYTNLWSGTATVDPGNTYTGTESFDYAGGAATAGTSNCHLVWNMTGAPAEFPSDCSDCQFAFALTAAYSSGDSTDDGACASLAADASFSYAFGSDAYGEETLFYGGSDGTWAAFVQNSVEEDLAGTSHPSTVSYANGSFSYSGGYIDFWYYEQ